MISGKNSEIFRFEGKTLIIYRSDLTFLDSGEGKKVFERRICNELLRDFLEDSRLEIRHKLSGSPYIDGSDFHLSVSHSGNWFALLISDELAGVDIQTHTSKQLAKGLDYFVNDREKKLFDNEFDDRQLYAIWGAKEAIYKYFEGAISDLRENVAVIEIGEKLIVADYNGRSFGFHLSQDSAKTIVWI